MTLRARLVAALVALLAVGMAVYGLGTYRAFAVAERSRLDQEVVEALPLVALELADTAGWIGGPFSDRGRPGQGGPPTRVAPGTYAELRDPDGSLVSRLQVVRQDAAPDLSQIPVGDGDARQLFTVGSLDGAGSWRVLVAVARNGASVIVAVPTTSVEAALRGLLAIEVTAGLALLLVLAAGSWLVLRAGLRPLERMAATARSITAGSLDQRVPVQGAGTEVAQLGMALNGMLDDLEDAFAKRAATEAKLRRFVADASHELRTPLTSIQGYAELVRLGRDSPHVDTVVAVRRIEEEAGRMRRLVEDLLTLARLDEPRPRATDLVDLAVLAADACSDAVALDPGRPVRLDAPHPVPLRGDEAHLRQAVTNLIANAVRHTPPGTPVEVSARHAEGRAILVVRDHGAGLDPEALSHVFDRFWQADAARAGTGVGLGLSIVQAIATEHGGTATAYTHRDGGAVFTLTFPTEAIPTQERVTTHAS